ncbi:unnamed protein product [Toxocara canis]|uniref:EGF-like domain-containing protein n=1 Tax=Toxocara canis TaxID=6265 RepID=A0A3P7F9K9_TOXCA|nr:unnamed protein product [Toxocara canis]
MAVGVSYLRKYHNLPKIPKIPEAKTKNKVSTALLSASNFNPCKITQLCQNGGKCVAIRGAYYCQCTPRFYGKTCEFLADSSKCLKNLCQNDATCYRLESLFALLSLITKINSCGSLADQRFLKSNYRIATFSTETNYEPKTYLTALRPDRGKHFSADVN